jgi:large subunit ribosomal protein L23
MKTAYDIIIRPVITEDSMAMTAEKKYVFVVAKTATKPEIASAVKELFNVDVLSVNTMNMKGKTKRVRYNIGRTASWKKAIVTLKPESKTIEFFDGMM